MELSKANAFRLEAMIASHLIWYKHYVPWADDLITRIAKPPVWLMDLSSVKYVGDATKILGSFVFSEPFESIDQEAHYRDYIGSLLLRYQRRELSWATFLDEAGKFTDCSSSSETNLPCEYFFEMLNDYEDSDFALALEKSQASEIAAEFQSAVDSLIPIYQEFRSFYPVASIPRPE